MRRKYFSAVIEYLNISPTDFPEPANRKKRKFEILMPVPPDPPKDLTILSEAELKAQKKKDRQLLNQLKLRIQPIMDQIKLRYKKFRTGVIDESQIRYLFDEDDPGIVSTDLPPEQRRQDHFRPYEKGVDKRGEPGLVEVATGKFFYNLEIVTIEKRLSNGYYKRTKDFVSDIKKLAKDAKAVGDQERLLKANELQANVEVDMGAIEADQPILVAELEAVYEREKKREKEMVEKAKEKAAAEGRRLELMPSNVPPRNGGISTEESSGPIILGQPISNGVPHHPVTPSNPSQPSQRSVLTNGMSVGLSDLSDLHGHNHSNGTSVPSRGEGDTHLTSEGPSTERETQNSSFGPSAQTQLPFSYTGGPTSLQQRRSLPGSLSQRSAITPMAEGSNPHDYINYASTTSSDKPVQGSSGPFNTQSSNARNEGPDLSMIPEPMPPNSQLPDTQGSFNNFLFPALHLSDHISRFPKFRPGQQCQQLPISTNLLATLVPNPCRAPISPSLKHLPREHPLPLKQRHRSSTPSAQISPSHRQYSWRHRHAHNGGRFQTPHNRHRLRGPTARRPRAAEQRLRCRAARTDLLSSHGQGVAHTRRLEPGESRARAEGRVR